MFAAAITHFEQGLSLLAEHDLDAMSPVAIGADIRDIRSVIDRLEAQCARRVEVSAGSISSTCRTECWGWKARCRRRVESRCA